MKIAVTYENGQVFQHFGHCESFKFYDVDKGQILSSEVISAEGSGHGALAEFLRVHGADTLICGGIGGGARIALADADINVFPGVTGDADGAVQALLNGKLEYNANFRCAHHHHGEEHDCAEHCGGHSCGEDKHGCSGN